MPITQTAGTPWPVNPGNGPWNLSQTEVARWGQTAATDGGNIAEAASATAAFGPTQVPTAGGGYARATLHYLDKRGNEVNTAEPSTNASGYIDTSEYDTFGNLTASLTAISPYRRVGDASGCSAGMQ